MLPEEQIKQIREELDYCQNPLFFFHDDPDGLCSFLLLYKYKKEGKGVIVKAVPKIDEKFLKKVEEYFPDKIFILDIAIVEQEFIDNVNVPIIWIDHHEPLKREKVKYFNPRIIDENDNSPVTSICYKVTDQDLWIGACGVIADWIMPDFYDEFKERYTDLIKNKIKNPGDILFNERLGKLIKTLSFVLKGKTSEVMTCIKILTRIKDPYEILEQKTAQGKYIYKKFEKINLLYEDLLNGVLKKKTKENFVIYTYKDTKMSFTGDLANELIYKFPDKVIIIGREKDDEIRMSIRANKLIPPMLKKALQGLEGYGGGHEYACGANIKKKDFDIFIERMKEGFSQSF